MTILGAGPIDLASFFRALRMGAPQAIVADLNAFEKDRAMTLGAAGEEDHVTQADIVLGGKAYIVFECFGILLSQNRRKGWCNRFCALL